MSDENYVKPDQKAALRFPNFTAHFDSVPEAIERWHTLGAEEQAHAVLVCEAGDIYQPSQIPSLKTHSAESEGQIE